MPTVLPTGLSLTTITKRLDCGDALVSPKYKTLENLPQGAKVGTSSLRRKAQLLKARPDLDIHSLRGNVNTRLRKLEEENFDAIVLAVAGLKRLGFGDKITQIIPREICLPAVGQGALAIETREDDDEIKQMLEFCMMINSRCDKAERSFWLVWKAVVKCLLVSMLKLKMMTICL